MTVRRGTCVAQGVYTVCTANGGCETCQDQASVGMGMGIHMSSMVILGNMDGRASVKFSCRVVACE